jgi:hypothetical protein
LRFMPGGGFAVSDRGLIAGRQQQGGEHSAPGPVCRCRRRTVSLWC